MATHINKIKPKRTVKIESPFGIFTCISKNGDHLAGHSLDTLTPFILKNLEKEVACEVYPNTEVDINYVNNHANAVGFMEYRKAEGVARRVCRWNSKGKIFELPLPDEALEWVGTEGILVGGELHSISPSCNVIGGLCYKKGKPEAYLWVDDKPIRLIDLLKKKGNKDKVQGWTFEVINDIELHPDYGYFLSGNGVHNGQPSGFQIQYIKI